MRNKNSVSTAKPSLPSKTEVLPQYNKLTLPKLNQGPRKMASLNSYKQLQSDIDRISNNLFEDNQIVFKQLKLQYPKVSARSYMIYNKQTGEIIKSLFKNTRREIASLTKMMTAILSIQLCQKYHLNFRQTYFRITQSATSINGTTANLQAYQWINVNDLLYGLLLPSGNDAANVLAENLGAIIYFDKIGQDDVIKQIKSIDLTQDGQNIQMYKNQFMIKMNENAKKMDLKNSKFSNPHGLDYRNNYSSCQDIVKLSLYCISNNYFNKIVKSKSYKAELRCYKNKILYKKYLHWINTNKLLGKMGCKGLKTGYTPEAGGCLSTVFDVQSPITNTTDCIIIVVLGCKTQEYRFSDTQNLLQWYISQLNFQGDLIKKRQSTH